MSSSDLTILTIRNVSFYLLAKGQRDGIVQVYSLARLLRHKQRVVTLSCKLQRDAYVK